MALCFPLEGVHIPALAVGTAAGMWEKNVLVQGGERSARACSSQLSPMVTECRDSAKLAL